MNEPLATRMGTLCPSSRGASVNRLVRGIKRRAENPLHVATFASTQLEKHALDVVASRVHADAERSRDLGVAAAIGEQCGDFRLTLGQPKPFTNPTPIGRVIW